VCETRLFAVLAYMRIAGAQQKVRPRPVGARQRRRGAAQELVAAQELAAAQELVAAQELAAAPDLTAAQELAGALGGRCGAGDAMVGE
jgi:hypothetical protein